MEFRPPIESRSTEALLVISSDGVDWVPEARALARMELDRRGVDADLIKDRQQAFAKAVVAEHELRERNAKKSYTVLQLLGVFLIAPILMFGKVFAGHLFLEIKLGFTELDRDNYKRKYRQRMTVFVIWLVLLFALIAYF